MKVRADRRGREAFAVLAYSNMLTLNALIQLLAKKGILTQKEILDKVKEIEDRMGATKHPPSRSSEPR